jgi:tetratricopeptide (TPR) repeat protein
LIERYWDIDLNTHGNTDMTRNLQMAASILLMTLTTVIPVVQPQVSFAYTSDPFDSQTIRLIKPTEVINYYQKGLTAVAAGNLIQAMSDFDRVIELDPQYFQAYIERGNVNDGLGNLPGAIVDYTKAIALNPSATIGGQSSAKAVSTQLRSLIILRRSILIHNTLKLM